MIKNVLKGMVVGVANITRRQRRNYDGVNGNL